MQGQDVFNSGVCRICSRFIQVIVTGITSVDIIISSPELIVKNWSAAELTPLHSSKENVSEVICVCDITHIFELHERNDM